MAIFVSNMQLRQQYTLLYYIACIHDQIRYVMKYELLLEDSKRLLFFLPGQLCWN